jgi:hypothetical protein
VDSSLGVQDVAERDTRSNKVDLKVHYERASTRRTVASSTASVGGAELLREETRDG